MVETGPSVNAPAREKESIQKAKISPKLDFFIRSLEVIKTVPSF